MDNLISNKELFAIAKVLIGSNASSNRELLNIISHRPNCGNGSPQGVFEFSGPSVQAVMDRIPTAQITDIKNGSYIIEAKVYGDGIK